MKKLSWICVFSHISCSPGFIIGPCKCFECYFHSSKYYGPQPRWYTTRDKYSLNYFRQKNTSKQLLKHYFSFHLFRKFFFKIIRKKVLLQDLNLAWNCSHYRAIIFPFSNLYLPLHYYLIPPPLPPSLTAHYTSGISTEPK